MNERTVFEDKHNQSYANAIHQAQIAGIDSFQNWFNEAETVNQALIRGYWDFSCHILTSQVCQLIKEPEHKTALEIGYGGGRLLNAACSYFKNAIGVDIHNEQEVVRQLLKKNKKHNFSLLKGSGNTIDVEDATIDFAYSFIVLQHLPTFQVFVSYIQEVHRCLKQGGVAQLYFGRFSRLNVINFARFFIQGYKEIRNAQVNHTSLVIRLSKAKSVCANTGFRIVDSGVSYKKVPDGYRRIKGGQNYVTLLK